MSSRVDSPPSMEATPLGTSSAARLARAGPCAACRRARASGACCPERRWTDGAASGASTAGEDGLVALVSAPPASRPPCRGSTRWSSSTDTTRGPASPARASRPSASGTCSRARPDRRAHPPWRAQTPPRRRSGTARPCPSGTGPRWPPSPRAPRPPPRPPLALPCPVRSRRREPDRGSCLRGSRTSGAGTPRRSRANPRTGSRRQARS